ncbi:MAG: hypothetical protein SVU88_01560 [Candidatus Nanohaloarchaea archaeon]|nr:hypothetical protein [Candidatus Nanohaloarchaea archaeon]
MLTRLQLPQSVEAAARRGDYDAGPVNYVEDPGAARSEPNPTVQRDFLAVTDDAYGVVRALHPKRPHGQVQLDVRVRADGHVDVTHDPEGYWAELVDAVQTGEREHDPELAERFLEDLDDEIRDRTPAGIIQETGDGYRYHIDGE